MFKPLTRSRKSPRTNGGFADTQLLHTAGEDDYSGFAPTQMFDDELAPLADPVIPATPAAARAAASTSHSVLERAAAASAEDTAASQARATAQWAAAHEAQAHEAAHQARAVIAAQRHAGEPAADGAPAAPRTGLARLRAAFERLLPGGLLPLFVGVSVTMAMISAVLPMIDKP